MTARNGNQEEEQAQEDDAKEVVISRPVKPPFGAAFSIITAPKSTCIVRGARVFTLFALCLTSPLYCAYRAGIFDIIAEGSVTAGYL